MKASGLLKRIWRWIRWPIYIVVGGFILFVGYGLYLHVEQDKTDAAVAIIHAQKITLADVMGTNLPPTPNQIENDATVAGIDKNNNGVRDDVELAIFKKYPNSAKIRAAELQYALTEQMFLTKVFDSGTWKAVAAEDERAFTCMVNVRAERNEVETLVFNTKIRNDAKGEAFNFTTSYGVAPGMSCDISL